MQDQVADLAGEERRQALERRLAARLGSLLAVSPARLDPALPLTSFGLDSLTAVELQHGLATELGVEVALADLLAGWSLADLVRAVREELASGGSREAGSSRPERTPGEPGEHPLSHGQRGLWYLDRLAPAAGTYNVVALARVRGALDSLALERALAALVARHPALRTTFHEMAGEPRQRVAAAGRVDFLALAATGWEEGRVAAHLAAEGYRPFDLETGPLLRVRLLARSPGEHAVRSIGEHAVLIAVHHLVCDFTSLGVMVRELAVLYAGGPGALAGLPALPATYGDFVRRQDELLAGPAGERQWRYWQERLAGELPVLDLPADRARSQPGRPSHRAVAAALPAPVDREGLRALGRRAGATLYMTLLAAFQTLLNRYTGDEDLLVGSPVAGRSAPAWAGLVGYFVNTLALRSDLSGDPPFAELLGRVRQTALDAFAHADFPFALLAERLQPARAAASPPLVQALFALEKGERPGEEPLAAFALGVGGARFALADLTVESLPLPEHRAQFAITLTAAELGGDLAAVFELDADRFDATTAQRLAGHFATLLGGIVERPEERLGALPLLSGPERAQLLTEWNATAVAFRRGRCLHEPLAEQARRAPDVTAVVAGDEHLSYGELDARGDRLARRLRRCGVGPEVTVGFALDRSPSAVVAIFAIWKAGGAFLPLDPQGPRERTAFVLADAGAAVVLSLLALRRFLPDLPADLPVLCLDDPGIWHEPVEPVASGGTPENLAYVLYTSGSTGQPKGVLLPHRKAAHVVQAVRAAALGGEIGRRGPLTVGLVAAWIFDPALEQLLYLLSGGTLHLLSEAARRDGTAFLADLARHPRLDVLDATPSQLQLWLEAGLLDAPDLLPRLLVVGGEAMGEATWRALAEAETAAWNLYGPTECTVDSTGCRVRADLPGVRIGRPLPNVRVHVVDRRLAAVPIGVPGELLVAGDGVARGYLGRPDLTAERFLPDPFAASPGERLYRTGDRARLAVDGNLEFLGRVDRQIKLRGIRVEPGEIEAALCQCPGIAAAAVLAPGTETGDTRLVAYLAMPEGEAGTAAGLRAALAGRLPEAMIPTGFVFLKALPLTTRGKIDRRALAALPLGPGEAPGSLGLRGPVEELLAGIWQELLGAGTLRGVRGVRGVRGEDNFFALGGHSLLATRLLSRVRGAFGVELLLADLFAAPTLAGLAARIEAALRHGAAGAPPPVLPIGRERPLPLSPAQRRLWFLDRLTPGSAAYVMPAAIRLRGALRVAALAAALGAVVRRHEALRTVFEIPAGEDEPAQRIVPAPPDDSLLPIADLAGLPGPLRRRQAARLQAAEAATPFDLARGPLYRFRLLRLGEDEQILLVTFHHAVADGVSIEILGSELSALYRGSGLPPLPVQYADWAVWQRRQEPPASGEADLAWWRDRLAGAPTDLPLPADRPATPSGRGAAVSLALPAGLAPALAALAQTAQATLFMVLAAGWAALLSRLAGVDDLLLGTPVANRRVPEVERLIGFFVNTLPLRCDLAGRPGFRALLDRVRTAVLGVHAHQDVPFERLVEALQPGRATHHNPLFQVVFTVEEPPLAGLDLPGIAAELLPAIAGSGTAKFDLTLTVVRSGESLVAELEHATDRFDRTTARRWLGAFATLLSGIVAEPERPLAELDLLSPAERHQLAAEWNDTAVELAERSLAESFLRQAEARPEAVAVAFRAEQVSHGELARRSASLAGRLRERGVGMETPVGLAIERSVALIVGMLAVVRAGGMYVPLDPGAPPERLELVIRDSGARVVLREEDVGRAGGDGGRTGGGWPAATSPDSLACLIYTSGSTGTPKGVAVPQRAIRRLIEGASYVRLTPADRIAQASTPLFDAATFEIWGALLSGARLEVFPPGAPSLAELGREIRRSGVTVLWLTAGLFHQLIESQADDLAGVEQLLAGGDVLSPAHVALVRRRLPGTRLRTRLINGYGPTENTTFTCCADIQDLAPGAAVPIGRPIANTTAVVLDPELLPVPIGVAGELCAGGLGLARGYWGDPARTAERFVPDPLGRIPGIPGARRYRTGDRARYLADGRLEFLGRLDRQVKVRGFRIEPGGVEAVLAAHPGVRAAAVEARPEPGGGRRLVAWVVAAGPPPAPAELRRHLMETLPEPAVPSAFVLLSALPLTAQGKVDRRALLEPAEPAETMGEGEAAPEGPRTPFEEMLAAIWCEVLGRERVGVDEDFFALGGHSLLATRVASRVRTAFGVDLPLAALFEAPTVSGLAARIAAALHEGRGSEDPPLVAVPRQGDLPLSFAQERLWFLDQLEPERPFYNIAGAVRLSGDLAVPALTQSLAALVARHEALRTTFPARDGAPVQVVSPPGPFPLGQVDLGGLPAALREQEVRRLAVAEAARPFDLARGPLLRATLLRLCGALPGAEHVLLFTLHHIVGDGWSMAVLLREVGALYGANLPGRAGRPSPLAPLPVQYADFAAWQRRQLSPAVVARELDHWRTVLAGAPALLDLPLDRPRPARPSFRGGEVDFAVPAAVAASLAALARRAGATPFMTFLAAFAVLLARYTGQEELTVGTPVANRTRREIEGLIGFFVNTLVLRADLTGDPPFPVLLDRLRRVALDAYTHQDLPFERLVGELAPGRDLAVQPLFQVLFTLEEPLLGAAALPGLASAPLAVPDPIAKFDLALLLSPPAGGEGGGHGVRASLSYRRDLFDRPTIVRLAGHLSILLAGLAEDPARPLAALPLLGAAERHQLRAEWNDTALPAGAGECPHDLFAAAIGGHPDRVAVEMEGRHLSYAGLDAAANRLARHFVALGVERESRVAVLLDRCPELLVAFLASARAGGVYLPLAPSYPRQRLALLLAESAPAVLLTAERVLDRVGREEDLPPHGTRVVCLDRHADRAAIAALPGDAFPPRARPEDLAYLFYTSGSTGTPKGVMIEHRNLACYLHSIPGHMMTGSGDVISSWTPSTFDLSLIEWSHALLTGGTVLLVPEERVLDLPTLVAATLSRATSLVGVPAVLRQIVLYLEETGAPGAWLQYRNVSAGGDSLGADLMQAMRRVFPRAALRNLYGPTEITMLCTVYRVPAVGPVRGDAIGRPIGDVVLRLLDRAGHPVPIGVPGELWIGGGGVGRGYFQRPELTVLRYVEREGRRFFRSGDLARYLPDGTLLFLGRLDTQVKLRGLRIELGEIEAALAAQPAVAEAVVALRGEGGAARLVAYVVPRPGERLEAAEIGALRRALAERLPEALVPAAFVALEALPKSAHGKVDRRALPTPEPRPALEAAPRTPLERTVALVWQEVLGIERVGIDDNFFELGGSSLLLVRLRSRLAQALGRDVAVVDLFQHPTIRALAEHLARAEGAAPVVPEKQAADLARTQTRRESLARLKERRGRPR